MIGVGSGIMVRGVGVIGFMIRKGSGIIVEFLRVLTERHGEEEVTVYRVVA